MTTDPLAEIDARIAAAEAKLASYRAARAVLAELLGAVAADPGLAPAVAEELREAAGPASASLPLEGEGEKPAAKESPGKPQPRPAAGGPGKAGGFVARVLELLAEKGPLRAAEMGPALGCRPNKVSIALTASPALFRKQPGNLRSPWGLTDEGRAASRAATA